MEFGSSLHCIGGRASLSLSLSAKGLTLPCKETRQENNQGRLVAIIFHY
ncbi:MAG: hypothetical protein IPL20_14350 [Saprospiraceae bacterium]|nr:hypothetical protein [Saprospiraceae bacterium]